MSQAPSGIFWERQFTLYDIITAPGLVKDGIRRYIKKELQGISVGGTVQRRLDDDHQQIIVLKLRSHRDLLDEIQAKIVGEGVNAGHRENYWSFTVDHNIDVAENKIYSFKILKDPSKRVEKGPDSDCAFDYVSVSSNTSRKSLSQHSDTPSGQRLSKKRHPKPNPIKTSSDIDSQSSLPVLTVQSSTSERSKKGHEKLRIQENIANTEAAREALRIAHWECEEAFKLVFEARGQVAKAYDDVKTAQKVADKACKKVAKALKATGQEDIDALKENKGRALENLEWAIRVHDGAIQTEKRSADILQSAQRSLEDAKRAVAQANSKPDNMSLPPLFAQKANVDAR